MLSFYRQIKESTLCCKERCSWADAFSDPSNCMGAQCPKLYFRETNERVEIQVFTHDLKLPVKTPKSRNRPWKPWKL